MFVHCKPFHNSLIFSSKGRLLPNIAPINCLPQGRLIALLANIRPGMRGSPGTNTLAYFAFLSATKKNVFSPCHLAADVVVVVVVRPIFAGNGSRHGSDSRRFYSVGRRTVFGGHRHKVKGLQKKKCVKIMAFCDIQMCGILCMALYLGISCMAFRA